MGSIAGAGLEFIGRPLNESFGRVVFGLVEVMVWSGEEIGLSVPDGNGWVSLPLTPEWA